jgi:hypothetical protein
MVTTACEFVLLMRRLTENTKEVDFPMIITDSKGKENDPPKLRIGLKWDGRQRRRLEELGLPTCPPGKMFRSTLAALAVFPEQRAARSKLSLDEGEEATGFPLRHS